MVQWNEISNNLTAPKTSDNLVTAGSGGNGEDRAMVGEGHQAGAAADVIHFEHIVGSSDYFHPIGCDRNGKAIVTVVSQCQ